MNTPQDTSLKTSKISFLRKIIQFARNDDNYDVTIQKPLANTETVSSTAPQKSFSARLRDIKAAVIVAIIFYILLCAFILINPQFSLFFNNIFGIEYVTIRFILEYTIYVFYSVFGILLGVVFLFFGYRGLAIKTKKKYKQTVLWLLTVVFGGFFFGNVALFAWTYNWFLAIDFSNIQERVLIYDNVLLGYKKNLPDKKMPFFQIPKKAIGPLNIRYDISPQIKKVVRENGLLLSRGYSFSIDYNGDGDPDVGSGDNIGVDLSITNPDAPVFVPGAFDEPNQYKATATLRGVNAGGEKVEVPIEIPDVLVQNVVNVSRKE